MNSHRNLGGTFRLRGGSKSINRLGYGGIHLTGPMAWGEPRDRALAVAVVREAVALSINHIDTSGFYGPHMANQIIKEAIHPYPEGLVIATKVGIKRGPDKSWLKALSEAELTSAVQDNLQNLGIDALDVVNLRVGEAQGTNEDSISKPLRVLIKLKDQGIVRHIGLSNISPKQLREAEQITEIACVQNHYNLVHRRDDALIDELVDKGIAFVPFFPLGGFHPIQSSALEEAAASVGSTPRQVALAWLLQRSPNILVIAGTSSVEHLRQNVKACQLQLPSEIVDRLNGISGMTH